MIIKYQAYLSWSLFYNAVGYNGHLSQDNETWHHDAYVVFQNVVINHILTMISFILYPAALFVW